MRSRSENALRSAFIAVSSEPANFNKDRDNPRNATVPPKRYLPRPAAVRGSRIAGRRRTLYYDIISNSGPGIVQRGLICKYRVTPSLNLLICVASPVNERMAFWSAIFIRWKGRRIVLVYTKRYRPVGAPLSPPSRHVNGTILRAAPPQSRQWKKRRRVGKPDAAPARGLARGMNAKPHFDRITRPGAGSDQNCSL